MLPIRLRLRVAARRLAPILLAAALQVAPEAIAAEIVINIPAFTLYFYEGGVPVRTFPIGVGQVVKPSQLGTTQIINKVHYPKYYPPDWYASGLEPIPPGPENPVGTRWLGLGFKGYGIHGTNNPESIGKAASAGCVRMHNRDVEVLAELVGVGTSVTFLYETIEVWRDPLTFEPYVRIYHDVYHQGTNTMERLLERLARIGADDGVDRAFLSGLLAEASGEVHTVPIGLPLYLNGEPVEGGAVWYGKGVWVSLDALGARLGDPVTLAPPESAGEAIVSGRLVPESIAIGGKVYAPLERAAEAFGLLVEGEEDESLRLRQVDLTDGARYRWRAYVDGERLLVPVTEMGAHFGRNVKWDPSLQALIVDGRPVFGAARIGESAYLAHDRAAALLGVDILWSKADPVAQVAPSAG